MINIVEALEDQNLFGPWFSGPSWAMWKAVLKGAFAIPMTPEELALFRAVAQRDPPKRRVRELWCVVRRRGGKDSIASGVACFASGFIDYRKILRPGEAASVLCLAVDKAQASIVQKYTQSYFTKIPLLRGLVTRETSDGLDLSTAATRGGEPTRHSGRLGGSPLRAKRPPAGCAGLRTVAQPCMRSCSNAQDLALLHRFDTLLV